MPTVSVIVPTRKRHHLLPRALDSLLVQTHQDLDIVVVDDNPEGFRISAQPALRKYLGDARIRILEHSSPRNAARARNVGLAAVRGEWVTYLDDDDAYHPTKIERQLQAALASGLSVGLCGLVYHLPHRRRELRRAGEEISGDELLLYFPGMPTVFHRPISNLQFDESLGAGEDLHLYQRLLHHVSAHRVFNVPEVLIDVYVQTGSRVNLNAEGNWKAALTVHSEFGLRYSFTAREAFLLRARLGYCKLQPGGVATMIRAAVRLLQLRGRRELRFVLNSFLFKLPWIRRWLVS